MEQENNINIQVSSYPLLITEDQNKVACDETSTTMSHPPQCIPIKIETHIVKEPEDKTVRLSLETTTYIVCTVFGATLLYLLYVDCSSGAF